MCVDQLQFLADDSGAASFSGSTRVDDREDRGGQVTRVLEDAARHYRAALATSPEALSYLRGRGVTRQSINRFGLGFARPAWRDLFRVFRDHEDAAVVDSGLLVFKDNDPNGVRFDRFRNRVMFPIRDLDGVLVGFGGRPPCDEPTLYAKYLNSPETEVFCKRELVYGLFEAQGAIATEGMVVVVEGYLDAICLAQVGIANAAATMGTACTAAQLAQIFALTNHVVFCFDGDAAGRKAAARALRAVLPFASKERRVDFMFLPDGHDPDSFVRAFGRPGFDAEFDARVCIESFLIQQAGEGCDLDALEGRSRWSFQARAMWALLPEGRRRWDLIDFACAFLGMDEDSLLCLWYRQTEQQCAPLPSQPDTLTNEEALQ